MGRTIKSDRTPRPMPRRERPSLPLRSRCYLCGTEPKPSTREHVIPKHIFSPNTIENPLILTACEECNQKKKNDDEYTAIIMQSTSESKDSFEAFDKTITAAKRALSPINARRKPGAGLIMALKKNTSDAKYLKRGNILVPFNGGTVKLDVPRLHGAFINMAKGVIVNTAEEFMNWGDYKFKVQFDQTDFPQVADRLFPAFKFVCDNAQYVEKWEDALFIAGLNHIMKSGNRSSLVCFTFFGKFVVVVTMIHPDELNKIAE